MADPERTADAAAKALEDPEFARLVLSGDKYPDVKQAILEELGRAAAQDEGLFDAFVASPASNGRGLGELAGRGDLTAPKAW